MRTKEREFEIVVAKYKENLNWLIPYLRHVTIYNKDESNLRSEWIHLPNVGRESHTYLHHIIQNYDDLADMTLFTQGNIQDIKTFQPLWTYGIPAPFRQHGLRSHGSRGNHSIDWGKLVLGSYAFHMRFSKYSFGEWWDLYIREPRPDPYHYIVEYKAVFSVHRNQIRSQPKQYYEMLISLISDHSNPEEGHYFERAWYHIFCPTIPKEIRSTQRDFEIVVAKMKDKPTQFAPYQKHITIYNKYSPDKYSSQWFSLPNIGRESHTYLHHIIKNYDNLATMTLFIPGTFQKELAYEPLWIYGIPKPFYQKVKEITNIETIQTESILLRPSTLTFSEWWVQFISQPMPKTVCINPIFSVHRDVIRSHPKQYYESLISFVKYHPNPEESHYMERSWYFIFANSSNAMPIA